jgi:gamma-glutamylputrescine oxidase
MNMWSASLVGSDTQLNQKSYYEASLQRPAALPPLEEALDADVVVVGAGFSGLSAALELAQRGLSVVVLEADRIGSGASGRNGGQAIVGYASGMGPFERQLGAADAQRAWDMSLEALDLIDARIAAHGIECDRVNGYVYVADSPRKALKLHEEMEGLKRRGIAVEWAEGADVPRLIESPRYLAAGREQRSGHLHPLKYALGLARAAQAAGVHIFEHSPVTDLQRGSTLVANTPKGQVRARFGVLAGNCMLPEYGPRVAPEVAPRIMPVGTYIVGTAPLDPALCARLIPGNAAVCDNNFVLDYFRFAADTSLLYGGRVSYSTATPMNLAAGMHRRMAETFPQLAGTKISHAWGGFVDISMNRAPDFGRLPQAPNVYYLQGFSGHGLALTGLAGRLVAEAISGDAARFDTFARIKHRPFPGGRLLRMPALVLGMAWYRLRDALA